ncbi:MAG: 3'-5' exonuclease, partial [Candidatus Dormibacteraceae bacterium]
MAQLIPELASDPQASRRQVGPLDSEPAFVALDLETTGFDAEHDRVIEVGAVAFTTQGVLGRLEMLANPERAVPAAILELTGIDPAELAVATTPSAALERLAAFMAGREAVGHGARLDLAFLTAAGRWPVGTEILDTVDLARIFLPGAPSYSLPLLVRELKLLQPRPHRALDDADATRQLLL